MTRLGIKINLILKFTYFRPMPLCKAILCDIFGISLWIAANFCFVNKNFKLGINLEQEQEKKKEKNKSFVKFFAFLWSSIM